MHGILQLLHIQPSYTGMCTRELLTRGKEGHYSVNHVLPTSPSHIRINNVGQGEPTCHAGTQQMAKFQSPSDLCNIKSKLLNVYVALVSAHFTLNLACDVFLSSGPNAAQLPFKHTLLQRSLDVPPHQSCTCTCGWGCGRMGGGREGQYTTET